MISIDDLLGEALEAGASDIHLSDGRPPFFRVDGLLKAVGDHALDVSEVSAVVEHILQSKQRAQELLTQHHQADFSYALGTESRFRVNVFKRRNTYAAAFRLIPRHIRTPQELNLPPQVLQFADLKQGFILVVGPAGHGKSTSLAALIDHINKARAEHIITIEDPIEYEFTESKSLIDQREIGQDAVDFASSVRSTLRQDPNVIMIGELRDLETMQAAITVAETGHLVFATLHTNDASQTVERLIDSFPPNQQRQIRSQLAVALSGVVSQRLLPWTKGGRIPAIEILTATPAVRNVIREGNVHQIPGIIQTSAELGMQTLDASLQALVDSGAVTMEAATPYFTSNKLSRR
jgi:twitching motility protein PilT